MEQDKKEKIMNVAEKEQVKSKKPVMGVFLAIVMCVATIFMAVGLIKINESLVNINKQLDYQRDTISSINTSLQNMHIKEMKFKKDQSTDVKLTTTTSDRWYVTIYSSGYVYVYLGSSYNPTQAYYLPMDSIYYIQYA